MVVLRHLVLDAVPVVLLFELIQVKILFDLVGLGVLEDVKNPSLAAASAFALPVASTASETEEEASLLALVIAGHASSACS